MSISPSSVGNYQLLERINVGGMAEVYKAKTTGPEGIEKFCAIKRILPAIAADQEFIEMFRDEARISNQLNHANIAQTFELQRVNETYFIVMEYVPGKDLRAVRERLRRRGETMPAPLACLVMSRVAEGLDYAHNRKDALGLALGIIHRDISPQNLLVSYDGEVKIIDFGIAQATNKILKTQAGILKGKFGYMSPEQVRGLPIDGRSDLFSLGIVLYELLVCERLFAGDSDYSILEKVRNAEVPRSELERHGVPEAVTRIVLRALAREPDERYQNASELHADLQRYLRAEERPCSEGALAAFMRTLFAAEFEREQRQKADLDAVAGGGAHPPGGWSNSADFDGSDERTALLRICPAPGEEPVRVTPTRVGRAPTGEADATVVRVPRSEPARPHPDLATREANSGDLAREEQTAVGPMPRPAPRPAAKEATAVVAWPRARRPGIGKVVAVGGAVGAALGLVLTASWWGPLVNRAFPEGFGGAPLGAFATLKVVTDPPDAALFVNDYQVKFGGLAPWSGDRIQPGQVRVLARKAGFADVARTVLLRSGEEQTLSIQLTSAFPVVRIGTTPPGARVTVDGIERGRTPAVLGTLEPGRHALRLELGCHDTQELPLVIGAVDEHVQVTLRPSKGACAAMLSRPDAPALLRLKSKPDAKVFVNGRGVGRTPIVELRLSPGRHLLRLETDDRRSEILDLELEAGQDLEKLVVFR